jgi:predicted DNA-binding transcriptional regulator YafY
VQRGSLTYLVAAPENMDDILIFAFHRMKEVTVLPETSRAPDGFDIDEYIASGAFGWGDGERLELEAIFEADAAEHLQETRLAEDQKLSPLPKHRMKIQATVNDTPQLEWRLLGFGDAVEVIRPEGLRSRMEQSARGMSRLYSGGDIPDGVPPPESTS